MYKSRLNQAQLMAKIKFIPIAKKAIRGYQKVQREQERQAKRVRTARLRQEKTRLREENQRNRELERQHVQQEKAYKREEIKAEKEYRKEVIERGKIALAMRAEAREQLKERLLDLEMVL